MDVPPGCKAKFRVGAGGAPVDRPVGSNPPNPSPIRLAAAPAHE